MRAVVHDIRRLQSSEAGTDYEVHVEVDVVHKSFVVTALKDQKGDVTWDSAFDMEFLRYHVNIGTQIMELVGELHLGRAISFPKVFTD